MTINEVFTSWYNMYGEYDSLPAATKLLWANIINYDVYDVLVNSDVTKYQATFDINTTGGKTYALPADFYTTDYYSCGLFVRSNGENQNEITFKTRGANLELDEAIPSGKTLQLVYIPKLTELTSLTDEVLIPDFADEVAVYSIDMMYAKRDRDYALAQNISVLLSEAYDKMMERARTKEYIFTTNNLISGF